ncbi:MAG: hypothetical protein K0R54_3930 [Clostridiaceae bacterium]|nr:hypothetical protein [Clostridiaceae bacterium]
MKLTGIVVEYNPFHNGHEYHIEKSIEKTNCDGIVAVMSGNFVQRGVPAIIDKWNRAKMALLNGVDLIIELPVIYSVSSAEFFAFGAVSLLNSIGVIENICFGSETEDSDALMNIAKILNDEPLEYKLILNNYLALGNSFPKARTMALEKYCRTYSYEHDISSILSLSNNILGIEYYKSLIKLNSSITGLPIKRLGSNYNDKLLNNRLASATAIREFFRTNKNIENVKNYLPKSSFSVLSDLHDKNYSFLNGEEMLNFIKYRFYSGAKTLNKLPDASEGLDNRIYNFIEKSNSFNNLIEMVKTKRYTYTRINRLLCQYFLFFDRFNYTELRSLQCPYARILGFNYKGREIIREMKKNSSIPIITKIPNEINSTLKADILATRAYSLLNKQVESNADYLNNPVIIKN